MEYTSNRFLAYVLVSADSGWRYDRRCDRAEADCGAIFPLCRVFKTLTEQVVTVELKNDLCIQGTLKSVDQ